MRRHNVQHTAIAPDAVELVKEMQRVVHMLQYVNSPDEIEGTVVERPGFWRIDIEYHIHARKWGAINADKPLFLAIPAAHIQITDSPRRTRVARRERLWLAGIPTRGAYAVPWKIPPFVAMAD